MASYLPGLGITKKMNVPLDGSKTFYSQTCIKKPSTGHNKMWPYKTNDLFIEVQFI